jgi:phage tail-like protein
MSEIAVGYLFKVSIDGVELGSFTKVDGIGARYDVMTVKEGGENGFVHQLPGRINYDNIKISRPVDKSSGNLARWFGTFQRELGQSKHYKSITASIEALGSDNKPVATWNLIGVLPVRYSGPSFQAGGGSVLIETVEIAHNGFMGS